jgi:hypothetical protein
MSSAGGKLRIVREPVEVTVDRLETYIARMEHGVRVRVIEPGDGGSSGANH